MADDAKNIKLMLCEPVFGTEVRQHWDWLSKILGVVGSPGTEVDYVNLMHGYRIMRTYTRTYNSIMVAQRALEAEKKGYDGFIIGCASDLGMKEARSIVKIPVIGSAEAAALMACTLGNKFSVITTDPTACGRTENLIHSYGLGGRLASVRNAKGLTGATNFKMMAEGHEQQQKIIEMLTTEMTEAVRSDGAEVLYASCLPTSALLTMHGVYEVEGAPIVNMFGAGLKLAENLVSHQKAYGTEVCKTGVFLGPHPGWENDIPLMID